jgi:predicted metal-binding membrane protein
VSAVFHGGAGGLPRRERVFVLAGLGAAVSLSWAYLIDMAAGMESMAGMMAGMMQPKPWTALDTLMMFVMWAVMMVGMMLPSATPTILLFAAVSRRHRAGGRRLAPVWTFVAGYIAVWTAYSLGATALQWGLERAALLSPMMASTSPLFGGLILIAAGLYQWSPAKYRCLEHCRTPVEFLSRRWRDGAFGALVMGIEHGAFCLGCCWILMALLFVGGVMNLLWVAALTVFVLAEKAAPFGRGLGQVSAGLLVLAGVAIIAAGA